MIIAFVMGFVVVIGSIVSATDRPSMFIDIPSIIVVFGGTFVTLFISFELKTALAALKLVGQSFRRHKDSEMSLKDEVGRIVRWGYIIQKNGLQGLENEVTEQLREENPFLAYGADLVVTGYTGAEIKQILTYMMESEAERAKGPVDALKKMGGDAPAFGMMGTLIGLVIMLGSMGGDPSAIILKIHIVTEKFSQISFGSHCSYWTTTCFLTKISARSDKTTFKENLEMEGLVLLAERKSPRYIQDKINSFVDVSEQFLIDRDLNNNTSNQTSSNA